MRPDCRATGNHLPTMATYFAGRVRHGALPIFTAPTGPDAPVLKRLLLPQGELAQFHDADEAMRYLAMIELTPGGVRGNHYHRIKKEFIYVIRGSFELIIADAADPGPTESFPVSAGEWVVIEPGVVHALRTREAGLAIEFSPARFDPGDTIRQPIV